MLELKWSEDGKETKRSEGERKLDTEFIFKAALEMALEQKLRIDVVIWDKQDRKLLVQQYDIPQMSDTNYLQFMYEVLVTDVIKRWRSSEDVSSHYWSIAPDQHSGLKFSSLQRQVQSDVIPENGGQTVVEILDEKCAPNYSLQLVDVFAGLGAFSHIHWNRYGTWLEQDEQIRSGFSATQALLRFPLLNLLEEQCSVNNFGVTILKPVPNFRGRGLWTREPSKPEHPINFWCYTP